MKALRIPLLALIALCSHFLATWQPKKELNINRENLVSRHNVIINKPDKLAPLLVGNGKFCYTADIDMMRAGWDGAPNRTNPGFPHDRSWMVKWEGLRPTM